MKTITKTTIFTAILLILTGFFVSCDEKENPPEPFLTIDESPITATADAGTFFIEVSSNGAWTAVVEDAENNDWCTLTGASGSNEGVIIVNIAKNPLYTTRSATVKIILGSLTKSVVVNQEAAESPKLTGTSWKLVGFVDTAGITTVSELEDCINCFDSITAYTLMFDPERPLGTNNFLSFTRRNEIWAKYVVDYEIQSIYLIDWEMTLLRETEEGMRYVHATISIYSFSLHGNELRLYYNSMVNNDKGYLLFKPHIPVESPF
jgi:hypothetical protein